MKFVFNRDRTIASVFGHVIHFPKGVPTHVPPEMHKEVFQAGGVPEGDVDLDEPAAPQGAVEPVDPTERERLMFAAFEKLVLRNRRDDFTASGAPHPKALARELGWMVQNKERDLAWVKFRQGEPA